MHRQSMVLGWLLLLVTVVSVGCSLVEGDGDGPVDGPDGGSGVGEPATGTIIVTVSTEPANLGGSFTFTGVPTGTIPNGGTLVVSDLEPGTYTTTQVDPAPDFDVTAAVCDDGDSETASSADPQTRTAVVNLEAGETVTCQFTNTRRAAAVVAVETEPGGAEGSFQFTGVPTGTVPAGDTLVVANLKPGTYTTTEVDPAPRFDLTAVTCDDEESATVSGGDPATRSAIFQLDPGETVRCTFINARRGTIVITPEISPEGESGLFRYTGVPSGTVSPGGGLTVANLSPGTYTTTEVDPAPDFELTDVTCDDDESESASAGDAATRTAVVNLEAGETVRCVFTHEAAAGTPDGGTGSGTTGGEEPGDGGSTTGDGVNPFSDPDEYLVNFPLPDELPADAGTYAVPKAGPWTVTNLSGQMDCGATSLAIPASPPESGSIDVQDGGRTLVGTSLQDDQTAPVVMTADADLVGRYTGAFDGMEQGVPVTINYVWQVVTDEYIVGYLTSSFTAQGVTCEVYRPYELRYSG